MQRLGGLLSQRQEIEFACVHGSFLDPELAFRDIDVALWADPISMPEGHALDYELSLSERLERDTPYPVDVKILNYTSLGFRYAASGGALIYARDLESWFEFREKTSIEYVGFLPWSKQMLLDLLTPSES